MGRNRPAIDWPVFLQRQARHYSADAEGLRLGRIFGALLAATLGDGEPDSPGFNQADKDPDDEVEILGGCVTGRRGKPDTAAAEIAIQSALVLHDHICQGAVKNRDGHAQQQSADFYDHMT
jgi:hypothetical protein